MLPKLERVRLALQLVQRRQAEIDRIRALMNGERNEYALDLLRARVQWDSAHLQFRHAVEDALAELCHTAGNPRPANDRYTD